MGVHDCGYRHATGTDLGVHAGVDADFSMRCTVLYVLQSCE